MQYPSDSHESWSLSKPVVTTTAGLVASQHYAASQIGAAVLQRGGNAVDAAVATSFAISVLEPWMSGLGGGGFMLVYAARAQRVTAVDFGMIAPQTLDPADYPLVGGRGTDLFNWPAVYQDRNLKGYYAMTVPGHVAGMALALATFGTRPWAELLAPAIALAETGLAVDWYATLKIAAAARHLAEFPASRELYLPGGFAPAAEWGGPLPRLDCQRLAATLTRLAKAGPDDFYTGALAAALVADVADGGGRLSLADLAAYRARLWPVTPLRYRDAQVYSAPGLTAGPTLQQALQELAARWTPAAAPDASAFAAYAESLLAAYAARLDTLGDSDDSAAPACTTHISVVDRQGNLVTLTQTLLSVFGSKVVLPQTGILMNNGIMWFDPRPGKPNSIAPARRPLSNMCPTLLERADGTRFALGASGGRRILPAVYQLLSFLVDYGMDLDAALHQPRLDVSGTDLVTLDARLPEALVAELAQRYSVRRAVQGVYPNLFACPNVVSQMADGRQQGGAFIPSPWAAVVGADCFFKT